MEGHVAIPSPHWADYLVLGVFLLICLGIGMYHSYKMDKQKTLENYLLGNRQMQLVPVSISLFVTFASAISLMGIPTEMYVFGAMGGYIYVGQMLAGIFGAFTIVPLLYPLRVTSTYEYLERRFHSKAVRIFATLLGMLQTIAYMGVCLYSPALALQTVARVPLWLSIVGIGAVGTIYTSLGGIKTVVWTDVFQCVMVFTGLTAVIAKGFILIGDPDEVYRIANEGKRLTFNEITKRFVRSISIDPTVRHTIWGLLIGMFVTFLPNFCNQSSIQRVSSLKSLKEARYTYLIYALTIAVYSVMTTLPGILMYVYYNIKQCDPVESGILTNINQLMPYYVFDILRAYPGLPGVFVSCLFSGSLSTLSSGMNALAANTVEDFLSGPLQRTRKISPTTVAKIAVCVYGGLIIGIAYLMKSVKGPITQITLSIFGACGGPSAGLFFLGGMFPNTNWIGALCGSVLAFLFNLWISIGSILYGEKTETLTPNPIQGCFSNHTSNFSSYTDTSSVTNGFFDESTVINSTQPINEDNSLWLYNLSYVWYGMIGFLITIVIGVVVSCCTGFGRGYPVDSCLIMPFCRRFWGLDVDKEELIRTYKGRIVPSTGGVMKYHQISTEINNSPRSTLERNRYSAMSEDRF